MYHTKFIFRNEQFTAPIHSDRGFDLGRPELEDLNGTIQPSKMLDY